MARQNIDVIITVRDAASKPLDDVTKKIKGTGQAAKGATVDFIQFNKTLFTTGAFIATFVKGFEKLAGSLEQGAELDRLSIQYERVMGPKGRLFGAIDSMTTTTIDRMEAMRAGVSLASLGIVGDSEQLADMIARSGTAAKMAGLDASEGIQKYTAFLKDGNVSNLEFLNLIAKTNPALMAEMAILNKAGGVMGGVISTQARLAMGQRLLRAVTEGNLKGLKDLKDITQAVGFSFNWLKGTIGTFLGAALGPLIEKIVPLIYKFADTLESIKKNDKEILFLTRAFILATSALAGFVAVLGTLRLTVRLLGFAGIGLPGLVLSLLTLTTAFLGITNKADSFIEKLKIFGGFIQGIWQLVTNLDPETGFSLIDEKIQKMLRDNGLLKLAKNIARFISVAKTGIQDLVSGFEWLASSTDRLFGGVFSFIIDKLTVFNKNWSNWWVSDALSPVQKFARGFALLIKGLELYVAGSSIFGLLTKGLSKLPIIGKIFGGKGILGSGPSGKAGDPVHVTQEGNLLGNTKTEIAGGLLSTLLGQMGGMFGNLWITFQQAGFKQMLSEIPVVLELAFPALTAAIIAAAPVFAVVALAAVGAGLGLLLKKGLDILDPNSASSKGTAYNPRFGHIPNLDTYNKVSISENPDKVSAVTVPKAPEDQLAVVEALGEQMQSMDKSQKASFSTAISGALANGPEGPGIITYDELKDLQDKFGLSNELLSQIATNTKERAINQTSRRGP